MLLKANSLKDNDALEYLENDFDKLEWTWSKEFKSILQYVILSLVVGLIRGMLYS